MTVLPILCFNDVYRVNQRYVPQPGAPEYKREGTSSPPEISVSQFAKLVQVIRDDWPDCKAEPGNKDSLILFAGDVFNPSVESSVTRGSHMVPVMNALQVDCACVGNHDFDFGFPHLTKLIQSTTFPWLLSNIVDGDTGKVPEPLRRYWVTERAGVRIGIVGLVEEDWIATIPSWPDNFVYKPMRETALEISKELRDPNGEYRVDIIIALTHCRVPNDIRLAKELGAVNRDTADEHGVDLLIGGHDHIYYIGKGADKWEGFSGDREAKGTEGDDGVRLIKSGTDFRDLSSAQLHLSSPSDRTRRRRIERLEGKHHYVLPGDPISTNMAAMLKSLLSTVSSTLSTPVCWSLTPFDARSEVVRTRETGLGNWVADVLIHAYAESLFEKGSKADGKRRTGVDAVIICGGTLRGDSQYGPGKITLGDILEILPFEDPVVCVEIDGKGIWDTMESALSKWPAQEGRFPIVSGLRVEWDHTLPPGQRVKSIVQVLGPDDGDKSQMEKPADVVDVVEQEDGTRVEVNQRSVELGEPIPKDGSKKYRVITREYMAEGYDGFTALKGRPFIIDDENGNIMSSIIRSFLLGSAYIFRHKQLAEAKEHHLSHKTSQLLDKARAESVSPSTSPVSSPRSRKIPLFTPPLERSEHFAFSPPGSPGSPGASFPPLTGEPGRRHVVTHDWSSIRAALWIAKHEHMSAVDNLKGGEMRSKRTNRTKPHTAAQASFFVDEQSKAELKSLGDDLAIVCPMVDGRMKDLAADPPADQHDQPMDLAI